MADIALYGVGQFLEACAGVLQGTDQTLPQSWFQWRVEGGTQLYHQFISRQFGDLVSQGVHKVLGACVKPLPFKMALNLISGHAAFGRIVNELPSLVGFYGQSPPGWALCWRVKVLVV